MDKLPRQHRYTYTLTFQLGNRQHQYVIVSRHGAVSFHVTEYSEKYLAGERIEDSGGLERHYRTPPDYMDDSAPSHDSCSVLGGPPCWHDGTSLYATETPIPRWKLRNSEEEVFGWPIPELDRLNPAEPA